MNLLPPVASGTTPNLTPLLIAALSKDGLALIGKLAIGDILTGVVVGKRQDGQMVVRTDRGLIALAGAIDAPEGSKVTLEVRATGARMQVVLLAIEISEGGQVPAASPQAPSARPAPTTAPAPLPADAASSSGTQVTATVLRMAENITPAVAGPNPLPPIAPGQRVALHVSAVIPPGEAELPPSIPAASFIATVRSLTPSGQPILDAPLGLLAVDKTLNWPAGTQVLANLLPDATLLQVGRDMPQRGWTGILQAAALFDLPDQPQLVALLERTLPRIGPHLAVGLAAMLKPRSDEPLTVSPELKAALAKIGRGELAAQLQQEFAELNRALPASEPGWRSIILPLVDENRLQQATLAVRRDPPKDGAEPGAVGSIHFLLDVELSRLGPLQLDGLIRGKRLDLMLRSQKPLDAPMRREINEIFQNAQQATGYAGQLFFQAGAPFLRTSADRKASGVMA